MRVEVVKARQTLTDTLLQAAKELGLDLVDSNAAQSGQGGVCMAR